MILLSGGQTGADRGALEAAKAVGILTAGWAPWQWRTERGREPDLAAFGLKEHQGGYAARTRANVYDADAVLILADLPASPGTFLTGKTASDYHRPCETFESQVPVAVLVGLLQRWTREQRLSRILVAGNRESVAPGIQARVRERLMAAFAVLLVD